MTGYKLTPFHEDHSKVWQPYAPQLAHIFYRSHTYHGSSLPDLMRHVLESQKTDRFYRTLRDYSRQHRPEIPPEKTYHEYYSISGSNEISGYLIIIPKKSQIVTLEGAPNEYEVAGIGDSPSLLAACAAYWIAPQFEYSQQMHFKIYGNLESLIPLIHPDFHAIRLRAHWERVKGDITKEDVDRLGNKLRKMVADLPHLPDYDPFSFGMEFNPNNPTRLIYEWE